MQEGTYHSIITPLSLIPGSVVVKCSQTGKLHHVKLKDLSREDCEPLTKDDLVKGSELMADMKGKIYPIQFVQFKDKDKANMSNSQKSADKSKMRSNENLEKATPTRKEKSHGSNVRKRGPESDKDESGGLRDKTNVSEILARAKVSVCKYSLPVYWYHNIVCYYTHKS